MTQATKTEGYFHQRVGPKGGATAGWYRDYENKQFVFAFAVCHNDDLYNKKTGRDLVDERLSSDSPDQYKVAVTFDHLISKMKSDLKDQDVIEHSVIDQMMDEVEFADIKTKALVGIADGISSILVHYGYTDLQELVYGS